MTRRIRVSGTLRRHRQLDSILKLELERLKVIKAGEDKEKYADEMLFLLKSRLACLALLRYHQGMDESMKRVVDDIVSQEPAGVRELIEQYNADLEKEYGKAEENGGRDPEPINQGVPFI